MATFANVTGLDDIMVGVTFDSATTVLADKMLTHAENEVKKYLSKRYDLSSPTFSTTTGIPPLIRSLTETLAEANVWGRMSRGSKESLARAKAIRKPAIDCLEKIAEYKLDINATSGSVIADFSNTAYQTRSNTSQYTETFGEDDPLSWVVDPDKLDDIKSDRS